MRPHMFFAKELTILRRYHEYNPIQLPMHLICFKNWSASMVLEIIASAINLKSSYRSTHLTRLNVLDNAKVVILQEVNVPVLKMAVSKAATFLGASDVTIIDNFLWESDYLGRVFSMMSDVIFVATTTQGCVQRFAEQATVPVLCVMSRAHASLQALATIMATIEDFGSMDCLNIAYIGHPHPVLNSYLLLCPMLGANFRFKCCCEKSPVSPLLYKTSQDMTERSQTRSKQCAKTDEVLQEASVIIAGPTGIREDKIAEFKINYQDLSMNCSRNWIFFHTCPRGKEVDDYLFSHVNARTLNVFNNMQYIAAALMAKAVIGQKF